MEIREVAIFAGRTRLITSWLSVNQRSMELREEAPLESFDLYFERRKSLKICNMHRLKVKTGF
jgi:hypothetical protein